MRKQHPLWETLVNLRGNPRACVYTEPLWGIPFNLYAPYATLYMYSLGVKDTQIGLIASVGMVLQILFSILGGVVTDKLGRRLTTLIFDLASWSGATLLWALSGKFEHFLIAAALNASMRIPMNSWTGLLAEDAKKEQIVQIYTLIYISGLGAAFFSPLSGILVNRFGIVPTVRILYLFAFVLMTTKIIGLYFLTTETVVGRTRMAETKGVSIFKLLGQYGGVMHHILKSPPTLVTLGLMLVMNIVGVVNGTFWTLYAAENLGVPQGLIPLFPFLKSIAMLVAFFTFVPRVHTDRFRHPMFVGFSLFAASQLLLITVPFKGILLLGVSIVLEAFAISLINPLLDSMQILLVNPAERSRIISLIFVMVIGLSSPFGWISGLLSSVDRRLPFVLILVLLTCGFLLTLFAKEPKSGSEVVHGAV